MWPLAQPLVLVEAVVAIGEGVVGCVMQLEGSRGCWVHAVGGSGQGIAQKSEKMMKMWIVVAPPLLHLPLSNKAVSPLPKGNQRKLTRTWHTPSPPPDETSKTTNLQNTHCAVPRGSHCSRAWCRLGLGKATARAWTWRDVGMGHALPW
jgi:hypothetical protein